MKLKVVLKGQMDSHGISLTDLAKETGVPKQTIHNWLCGSEPKSLGQVRSVARYFDLTIEELCYGEVERKSKVGSRLTNPIEEHENEIRAGIFEVVLRRVKK
jgi:transcriptional regulator with XRE-family HTH domain